MRDQETKTQLNARETVYKDDERICLYGELDTLQAEVICTQVALLHRNELYGALSEILKLLKNMMRALVKDEPMECSTLLGYSPDTLRDASHNVEEHFGVPHVTPRASDGQAMAQLNRLRTMVRGLERTAVRALKDSGRQDILLWANRLSSALYVLMCKEAVRIKGERA